MRRQCSLVLCFMLVWLGAISSVAAQALSSEVLAPAEHRRSPDQTFLTFPEWYLVHSPAEYAGFIASADHPSRFPLYAHIGQFWQSYAAVNNEIAKYPFNAGYHLMVMVIGLSTTVEYALKATYEHTIGRMAEATKSARQVPEERFAARYAQSYVDFIRADPWYKFDFLAQLKLLWQDAPRTGPNLIRRWERRFALTSELLVKEGYARLIKLGSQTVYDAPESTTAIVLSAAASPAAAYPDLQPLGLSRSDGVVLATIPRYEGFTHYSQWLASQGLDFVEIAGNRGEVLVSQIGPESWSPSRGRILFEQAILTQPGRKRVVFAIPIAGLAHALRETAATRDVVILEHVYDF